MTKQAALAKAEHASRIGPSTWLVVHRPDHPVSGDTHYVISAGQKVKWSESETLVATYMNGFKSGRYS